jgi:hypothetical protein
LNSWIAMSIQRATENVQSRCRTAWRSSRPSARPRPFVGLFGTVWGIYNALVKIGVSGQASIDKVAGPVGESLIMTAIGLRSRFRPCSATTGWSAATRQRSIAFSAFGGESARRSARQQLAKADQPWP